MADFEVKVRNLETGEMLVASMKDCEEAVRWLTERPQNLEIVSVLSDTSPADQRRLKEAMRPYDADELALKEEFDRRAAQSMLDQYTKELDQIESVQAAAGKEDGDPNRPLSVKYEVDEGLSVVDDDRPITDAARAACVKWIDERNTWVKDKGQLVGEAHLEVWPNDVPGGDEERRVLEGGRFFPRLAN